MTVVVAQYQPPQSCKVYTPAKLAAAMIRAVGHRAEDRWLEPSFGHGVFLCELQKIGVSREFITAIDLEPQRGPADCHGVVSRGVDFLEWCRNTDRRFTRIVANPPYVSLLDLPEPARVAARNLSLPSGSGKLPARSNLWAAFLIGAVKVMQKGGAMSFVLPAAWEYADYASQLRAELPLLFAEWYSFRCEEPLFEDVLEGSVVIVGKGFGETHMYSSRIVCLQMGNMIDELGRVASKASPKVQKKKPAKLRSRKAARKLSTLVDIRLGGVAGDADFFLLRESQRKQLGLPLSSVRPSLSKAEHLQTALIDRSEWRRLKDEDARVWMFRPVKRSLTHPNVKKYLGLDLKDGGCNRSAKKISGRKVWYEIPLPNAVGGFLSGMTGFGPWISLSEMRDLTASNTLYTVSFKGETTLVERAALALTLLSSVVRKQLPGIFRRYAAGLHKLEPGDIQNLVIPKFPVLKTATAEYSRAVKALLSGNVAEASSIADTYLCS